MKWWRLVLLGVFFIFALRAEDTLVVHLDKYIVKPGDYLSKIEQGYPGVNWKDIYNLNEITVGKNPNLIYPDSTLFIPVGSSYIKEEKKELNYHLQAWVLIALVSIFILIYKKKSLPIINVQKPGLEIIKQGATLSSQETQAGEIKIERAPS